MNNVYISHMNIPPMNVSYNNGDNIMFEFRKYILNENNKLITKEFIDDILKKYGVNAKIKNLDMFQTAMIHISYTNRTSVNDKVISLLREVKPIEDENLALPLQTNSYGRLEFLGDAFIHMIIAQYLFDRYDENEGFMTTLRTKLERSETLSYLSKRLNLHEYVIIARNLEMADARRTNIHLSEDIFESFVGALYYEIGYEKCKTFLINLIESEIDMAEIISRNDNYKDRLMQYFHKMKWQEPKYIEIEKDIEHKIFSVCVFNVVKKTNMNKGNGTSKMKAEQDAAKNTLINLGVICEEEVDDDDYYGEV